MAFDDQEQNQDDILTAPWQRKPGISEQSEEQQATSEQNYGRNPEVVEGLAGMMRQYRTVPGPNGEYYRRVYPPKPKPEPSTSNESNESMFREILKKARTGDFAPGSRLMEIRDPNAVGSGPGYWPEQHSIFSTFYPGGKEAMLGLQDDSRGISPFAIPRPGLSQSRKPTSDFIAVAGTQPSSGPRSTKFGDSARRKSSQSTNRSENNASSQKPQSNPVNGQYGGGSDLLQPPRYRATSSDPDQLAQQIGPEDKLIPVSRL